MVEDAPDDLVHEIFAQQFWARPSARPADSRHAETVSSFDSAGCAIFQRTYVAPNLVVAAAGHLEHARFASWSTARSARCRRGARATDDAAGRDARRREPHKDIEQSHICIGTPAYPQAHVDRHALYVLNTILGGSMSSRLFQHIREERGLAYAVFSNLTTVQRCWHDYDLRRMRDGQVARGHRPLAGRASAAARRRRAC